MPRSFLINDKLKMSTKADDMTMMEQGAGVKTAPPVNVAMLSHSIARLTGCLDSSDHSEVTVPSISSSMISSSHSSVISTSSTEYTQHKFAAPLCMPQPYHPTPKQVLPPLPLASPPDRVLPPPCTILPPSAPHTSVTPKQRPPPPRPTYNASVTTPPSTHAGIYAAFQTFPSPPPPPLLQPPQVPLQQVTTPPTPHPVSPSPRCPVEQPRASTPAREERAELSVVSDRSSDSGLDSGHQSSDFDEQIDVVGDDEREEDEPGEEEEEEEEEEGIGHEVEKFSEPTSRPVTVTRPLPKRLTPELASPPCMPDLLRFGDPRFWQAPSQPYLPIQMDPRTPCHQFPPPMLPPHLPAPVKSAGPMDSKPPYLPFHPSLFKRFLPPDKLPTPGMLQSNKPLPWLLELPHQYNTAGKEDSRPARKHNEPPRYHCEACKKSYATFSGLSKHKQFHCESHVKKEFSCKYCDKRYTSLGALKMHIRTHTLPCKCQLCGKAFSRPWLLQGHIRTHTGEKPFSCQHCQRSFADRSNLRAHLQTHSDVKKYCCKSCSKTFSRMSLLLKHEENSCPAARANTAINTASTHGINTA